ncbi:Hypothetical protein FKW44_017964 [Caligus rogercresseyi]|uniref:Uncharacterized protein n=1 Tax=Caligus rogercresseyi TaxID=217165 RepID=A0A7T8JWB0_CALRO|nr:Hypothetical protein FKW44_017964 [Caligus rogercresseyi]
MDTPDFRSYFLIRIKLAKATISTGTSFTFLTLGLASPPSRDGERTSIMAVCSGIEYVIRKTPGDEDTEDYRRCEAPDRG